MSDLQTLSDDLINTMNDIYVMLSEDHVAHLTYELYSDESRIIEKVDADGTFIKRFFLNEEGDYPINLAGPAVTKVIPWNLEQASGNSGSNTEETFEPGYFLDLRQLKMSRLNMIRISDDSPAIADTPIPNDTLPIATNTFMPVPKDKQNQLKTVPKEANLYVAFFQKPDDTRSSSECYSYCVSYISAEEVNQHLTTTQSTTIEHLQTYYGNTRVQAGALNPNDFFYKSITSQDEIESSPYQLMVVTCYVANLQTFKS